MERRADMTYGERMRKLREDSGMSLRELAEKSLLDYSFLSRVENNLRTLTLPQAKAVARRRRWLVNWAVR
ncbi:helix-turn-helix domain-containing protein [Streptococcus sp. ZJ93]|uniref:helix-turn-helix domain-containing protein n=1 Tax=Streptococcus handemini TaxID=3161188 RepID=UPI0032ECA692